MIRQGFLLSLGVAAAFGAGLAAAQQYRWIDKDGKVQFSDTPPPPGAKDVRKSTDTTAKPGAPAVPFELARLQKDFPVTLYTAPNCKEGCQNARDLLNKRGIPFKEVQAWDPDSAAELKRVSGGDEVPVLVVGRTMERGYEKGAFNALLDSAGYPKEGLLPALSQKAPPPPDGYTAPDAQPAAKPVQSVAPQKLGPYDASGLQGPAPKPGPYDPSGLTGPAPKPGQYGLPSETK